MEVLLQYVAIESCFVLWARVCLYVCEFVRARVCVRARVSAYVHVYVCARVRVSAYECVRVLYVLRDYC